jgi:hypothetical protein
MSSNIQYNMSHDHYNTYTLLPSLKMQNYIKLISKLYKLIWIRGLLEMSAVYS